MVNKNSPRAKSRHEEEDVLGEMAKGDRCIKNKVRKAFTGGGSGQKAQTRKEFTPLELAFFKRRELREKGIYKPKIVPMTGQESHEKKLT